MPSVQKKPGMFIIYLFTSFFIIVCILVVRNVQMLTSAFPLLITFSHSPFLLGRVSVCYKVGKGFLTAFSCLSNLCWMSFETYHARYGKETIEFRVWINQSIQSINLFKLTWIQCTREDYNYYSSVTNIIIRNTVQ